MNRLAAVLLSVVTLLAGGIGGYVIGTQTGDSDTQASPSSGPTEVQTVTDTETVTEEVVVPKVPSACEKAVDAGDRGWELYDEMSRLYTDTSNSVDEAYNAGVSGRGSESVVASLDALEARARDINDEAVQVPFYVNARRCRSQS